MDDALSQLHTGQLMTGNLRHRELDALANRLEVYLLHFWDKLHLAHRSWNS
jgi:hypothetical protein